MFKYITITPIQSIISVYDGMSEGQNKYEQSNGQIVDDILLTFAILVGISAIINMFSVVY